MLNIAFIQNILKKTPFFLNLNVPTFKYNRNKRSRKNHFGLEFHTNYFKHCFSASAVSSWNDLIISNDFTKSKNLQIVKRILAHFTKEFHYSHKIRYRGLSCRDFTFSWSQFCPGVLFSRSVLSIHSLLFIHSHCHDIIYLTLEFKCFLMPSLNFASFDVRVGSNLSRGGGGCRVYYASMDRWPRCKDKLDETTEVVN